MTQRELVGAKKAFQYGINHAKESNRCFEESRAAVAAGDSITADVKQRCADLARGEALGAAQALALIGGVLNRNEYVRAIHQELGE